MASNSGGGIIEIVLLGGAAYVAWSVYQSYVAAQLEAAAAAASSTESSAAASSTQSSPSNAASSTPAIVIPANFTVTPDLNNSFTGYVTYNGVLTKFSLIFAGGTATGQVFNSAGSDITATLGAANVQTLVNAWNSAVQNELISGTITKSTPGMSGLGQVRRVARIAIPPAVILHRRHRTGIEA